MAVGGPSVHGVEAKGDGHPHLDGKGVDVVPALHGEAELGVGGAGLPRQLVNDIVPLRHTSEKK
jgi:hypothetical protein